MNRIIDGIIDRIKVFYVDIIILVFARQPRSLIVAFDTLILTRHLDDHSWILFKSWEVFFNSLMSLKNKSKSV